MQVRAADGAVLDGDLVVPENALGTVVFAHGSGSSRYSPRNRMVAEHLQAHGLATLLVDLLTADEEHLDARTRHLRFDVEMLAVRLAAAAATAPHERVGYFGASTGAAAALIAAADEPDRVAAVVSRGGRPDLAGDRLPFVTAPTLLIVGGADTVVLDLNREAMARLHAPVALEIVPDAGHLFEEPGALHQVAALAADWFTAHLS